MVTTNSFRCCRRHCIQMGKKCAVVRLRYIPLYTSRMVYASSTRGDAAVWWMRRWHSQHLLRMVLWPSCQGRVKTSTISIFTLPKCLSVSKVLRIVVTISVIFSFHYMTRAFEILKQFGHFWCVTKKEICSTSWGLDGSMSTILSSLCSFSGLKLSLLKYSVP
jgi:hypothetical protein